MDRQAPASVELAAFAVAAVIVVVAVFWTVIAFTGGRLWPTGFQVDGNVKEGLVWLFVVTPIALKAASWLVELPGDLAEWAGRVAERRRPAVGLRKRRERPPD